MPVDAPRPWYREPYVWLVIAIPVLAVISGLTVITIAVVSDDGLVVDDYYKRGKEINRVLRRDKTAAALGLQADLSLGEQGRVRVVLLSDTGAPLPDDVELHLSYATRAGIDQTVVLQGRGPGVYLGQLIRPLATGRWYAQLQTERWRLVGVLQAPLTAQHRLGVRP